MICDKCGYSMVWRVIGIDKTSISYYICPKCGNIHKLEELKEQET
jgi:predicted RNA-binding Zn-ribbon protein involved in translation (DUF1610 family)